MRNIFRHRVKYKELTNCNDETTAIIPIPVASKTNKANSLLFSQSPDDLEMHGNNPKFVTQQNLKHQTFICLKEVDGEICIQIYYNMGQREKACTREWGIENQISKPI